MAGPRALLRLVVVWMLAPFALACVCAPARAADPGWDPPVPVGPSSPYAYPQLVAAGSDGSVVATWQVFDSKTVAAPAFARFVAAHAPAGVPQALPGIYEGQGSLAGNGAGQAVLGLGDRAAGRIELDASFLGPLGRFAPPTQLTKGATVMDVKAAMNQRGDALIAADDLGYYNPTEQLEVFFHPAGGVWSSPVPITGLDTFADAAGAPHVDVAAAITSDGNAIVAWTQQGGTAVESIEVATGGPSGFSAPVTVGTEPNYVPSLQLVTGPLGGAALMWSSNIDANSNELHVSFKPPGGSFQPSASYATAAQYPVATLHASDDGRMLLAYGAGQSFNSLPMIATGNVDSGQLSPPRPFPQFQGIDTPVGIGAGGQAFVLDTANNTAYFGDTSGKFSPGRPISCPPIALNAYPLSGEVDAGGNASALADSATTIELLRSDPLLPAMPSACETPATSTLVPPPPISTSQSPSPQTQLSTPTIPSASLPQPLRVQLLLANRVRVTSNGTLPVLVLSRGNGIITARAQLTPGHIRTKRVNRRVSGTALTRLRLHVPRCRHHARCTTSFVTVTLHDGSRSVMAQQRVTLTH